jgi:general L-amino acid transport system substrate-binding protein
MRKYSLFATGLVAAAFLVTACSGGGTDVAELNARIQELETRLANAQAGTLGTGADATKPVGYGNRLEIVRDRGKVLCADNTNSPAWGYLDADGKNVGFGPDWCKAYAAAIFGEATDSNWEVVGISYAERPTVMQSGEIDVMTIANTWTALREIQWGNFVDIIHYAGLGVVSTKESGIVPGDWQSLNGMTGCTTAGTNYIQMAADMQAEFGIEFELNTFEASGGRDAYDAGRCDFQLGGSDSNAAFVAQLVNSTPDAHNVWNEVFGKTHGRC